MVFTLRPSAHLPRLATRAGLGTIFRSSDIARFVQGGVVKTFRCADETIMNFIGQIGGGASPIEFEAWSAVITEREGFRMDPWQGRDPATGAPTENPPSAMRVSRVVDGNDVGMVAFDESHLSVVVFATDDYAPTMRELAQEFAGKLSCDFTSA